MSKKLLTTILFVTIISINDTYCNFLCYNVTLVVTRCNSMELWIFLLVQLKAFDCMFLGILLNQQFLR